jgi:penicillin amidase
MPGGPYTPLAGQYLHDRPAAMVVGASYRQVIDLADPEGTGRMSLFGGQSGHVGSRHYDDLTPIWRRGGFLPMRLASWPAKGRDLELIPE